MSEEEKKAVERMKQVLAKNVHTFINELEIVLNLVEKLQKENEELREKWDKDTHILQNELDLTNVDKINNYIPVQKVKDKIEELKNKPLKINQNDKYYYETDAYNKIVMQVLQELLEGRK